MTQPGQYNNAKGRYASKGIGTDVIEKVCDMHFRQRLSIDAIASALGLKPGQVKVAVYNGNQTYERHHQLKVPNKHVNWNFHDQNI